MILDRFLEVYEQFGSEKIQLEIVKITCKGELFHIGIATFSDQSRIEQILDDINISTELDIPKEYGMDIPFNIIEEDIENLLKILQREGLINNRNIESITTVDSIEVSVKTLDDVERELIKADKGQIRGVLFPQVGVVGIKNIDNPVITYVDLISYFD